MFAPAPTAENPESASRNPHKFYQGNVLRMPKNLTLRFTVTTTIAVTGLWSIQTELERDRDRDRDQE